MRTPSRNSFWGLEQQLAGRTGGTSRGAKSERSVMLQGPRLLRAIKTSNEIHSGHYRSAVCNKVKIWVEGHQLACKCLCTKNEAETANYCICGIRCYPFINSSVRNEWMLENRTDMWLEKARVLDQIPEEHRKRDRLSIWIRNLNLILFIS